MFAFPVVGFCGSRALPSAAQPLVSAAVGAALNSGAPVSTGCATGADQFVLSALLSFGCSLRRVAVFCAFGSNGAGSAASSAVGEVFAVARRGASIHWWAGGGPRVPLRGRLAARSLAHVRFLASSGGCLVGFVSSLPARPFGSGPFPACGSGSWSSLAAAVLAGVPVFVVPAGLAPSALPALPSPLGGRWAPGPLGSFRWQPAAGLFG
jgi:hypothetical protein